MLLTNTNKCFYCEATFKPTGSYSPNGKPYLDRTADHIIPCSKGGNSSPLNKIPACRKCNGLKGNFLPESFTKFLFDILDGVKNINRKGKYSDDLIRLIIKNNNALIEQIEPYREKLYKSNNLQKDFEKDFSEVLKNNTERSKHITNAVNEVSNKHKRIKPPSIIHYQVEDWTVESFNEFFKGKKHFHTL